MVRHGCDRADLVLNLVLQLNPGRFNMIRKDVVQALPLLREVIALEHAQASDLVETDQTSLVEGNQELAS